ncbi:MAG: Hsp20/alpha crystallin family protein [Dehalococcoidales bacterium]
MAMERWRPRWSIRPWRPFRELEELERLLETPFAGWPFRVWRRRPIEEISWTPALDMYEKEDSFTVRMELPGVKQEDVDISITGDTLTVRGEYKPPAEVKEEEYQYCEMCYGSFSRSITMPAAVDADKIEATFENGILEIHLPKAKAIKPAKIKIKGKKTETKGK